MTQNITLHPTAVVEKGAELDSGVTIGPYAIIGSNVKIAKNTVIHSHAVIQGHTTIGEGNQIFSFAAIGNPPQDLKYKGEPTTLEIGHRNIIRECTTLQLGTVQGGGRTVIGNENLLMAYVHVAHDCVVGNQNVIANGTQLAGHVTIHNMAVIAGLTAIHQFVHVGDLAMTGGGSMVVQDIPPFCIAEGNRANLRGLNVIGMQRRGMDAAVRDAVKKAYKIIFSSPTLDAALEQIDNALLKHPQVEKFVHFIKNSTRGVARPNPTKNQMTDE